MIELEGVLVNPAHIVTAKLRSHVNNTFVIVELINSGELAEGFTDPNEAEELLEEIEAEVDMSNGLDWMGS